MSSTAIPHMREVRKCRPPQRRLALIAVVTCPIIVALIWDRALLGDGLRVVASLLLYRIVSFELRCGWVPFTVIGLLVGFVLDSFPRTRQIPQNHMR